jgi:transposase
MAIPRVTIPVRNQGEIQFVMPEDALPPEHPARVLWSVISRLDLSAFLADASAFEGGSGRPTTSPRMLLTLWTYAISRGVGSAREIERLTRSDAAYRWIVGDQRPGRTAITEFRVSHLAALDGLLTNMLAALVQQGALSIETVAIDGMRVRASASAPSFRREASLEELREQAELHLKAVLAQADDPSVTVRQRAAREAKARDFQRRVDAALDVAQQLSAKRKPGSKPARASSTDPDARVMKMGDGGFRPAMNVQMATAGDAIGGPRTIVAVAVTNVGRVQRTVDERCPKGPAKATWGRSHRWSNKSSTVPARSRITCSRTRTTRTTRRSARSSRAASTCSCRCPNARARVAERRRSKRGRSGW